MTTLLKKLQDYAEKAEISKQLKAFEPTSSGWLSRKLIVTLSIVAVLVWLSLSNPTRIMDSVTLLAAIYLAGQTIHDCVSEVCKAQVRKEVIKGLAQDGLTEDEIKTAG